MNRFILTCGCILMLSLSSLPLCAQNAPDSTRTPGTITKVARALAIIPSETTRFLPFAYYMNETGFMAGGLFYKRQLFHSDAKVTSVALWAPVNKTLVWNTGIEKFPIAKNRTLDAYIDLIKFNEIRGHWIGNDSPDYARKYLTIATPNGPLSVPCNKGYDKYKGWDNEFDLYWNRRITPTSYIGTGPVYKMMTTQNRDYKSDLWQFWWDEKRMDSEDNPHTGWRGILTFSKSLNLLSHDGENNWDYYKIVTDLRKYIPVTSSTTFALRVRVESNGGKEVLDELRTAAIHVIDPTHPKATVTTVAPFFDMAILGDTSVFRGYYYYRFYDNQSVLGQCEFHFPIIPRLQGSLFTEVGRVMPYFSTKLLTEDYHYVFGAGVRLYFSSDILARADCGFSDEGMQLRINLGQTF